MATVEVLVKGEIDVPADELWKRVRDFGEVGWMQGVAGVELEGEGVGMIRRISAGGGPAILERLESLDDAKQRLEYTITENNPLPVTDYHAHVTAVDLGGGRSRLEWGCSCEPAGVDDATCKSSIEGMYGLMVGWLKSSAEGGS